jgi:hypothetical protein
MGIQGFNAGPVSASLCSKNVRKVNDLDALLEGGKKAGQVTFEIFIKRVNG